MKTMRESWTDERLDDLSERVTDLGRRMDLGFAQVRQEIRSEIGSLRTEMKEMNARFDAMQRTMIQVGGGMFAALLGLIVTQL